MNRWEWRTFSRDQDFRETFADYEPQRRKESEELYLVFSGAVCNAKLRENTLDIKVLEQVNDDGLEQWSVAMKAELPIHPPELRRLYALWGIDGAVPKGEISRERLVGEVISEIPGAYCIQVHKERIGYIIDECFTERAEVWFDVERFFTAAVEHAEPGRVAATVRKLGLWGRENTSYIKALAAFAGMK